VGILAIYEVLGIQDYIFSSGKLRENLGASVIVQELLEKNLVEEITALAPGACTAWKEGKAFAMAGDSPPPAEVIYIGGGYALVAFGDDSLRILVNRALSRRVIDKTEGLLRVATAAISTDYGDFCGERRKLLGVLNEHKASLIQSLPLMGISITREGITDGLPAQFLEGGDYLSRPAWKKRESAARDHFQGLLHNSLQGRLLFPGELSDLGEPKGDGSIAIVHIDGNNTGAMLERFLRDERTYEDAVKVLRLLSGTITPAYEETMGSLAGRLAGSIPGERGIIPLRPLVLNGDKAIFVTGGSMGIACAEYFLRDLGKKSIAAGKRSAALSACAGVAIVRSHVPLFRACECARWLCQSAKTKGRIIAANSGKDMACWIDFHIVSSGITTELAALRACHYNIPGLPMLTPLTTVADGETVMKQPRHHVLWRPWCAWGDAEGYYEWEHLAALIGAFRKGNENGKVPWHRSRMKTLRNCLRTSKDNAERYVRELESRGLKLPPFNGGCSKLFAPDGESFQTPYFDALELLDYYHSLS